jgi:phospholipase C
VSFFGDGTRVPMVVISPYAKVAYVSHDYTDHVSILKFIERNWGIPPVSNLGIDNLPDPTATKSDPYVPTNRPAIGDLFDMFDFAHASASGKPLALGGRRKGSHLVHIDRVV